MKRRSDVDVAEYHHHQRRRVAPKKLALVLDLDHTLVNTSLVNRLSDAHRAVVLKRMAAERGVAHKDRTLFYVGDERIVTKVRPYAFEFLREMSARFELTIYTMGNQSYADNVAKILDPEHRFFDGRVYSREDSKTSGVKSLQDVHRSPSTTICLDDNVSVWAEHTRNVAQVQRYHYFAESAAEYDAAGKSVLETGIDEPPYRGQLACSARALLDLSAEYAAAEFDVRDILEKRRRGVLRGCRVVFSRCERQADKQQWRWRRRFYTKLLTLIAVFLALCSCWPINSKAPPQRMPLWRMAEELGAACALAYNASATTHVVSCAPRTEKAACAQRDGRCLVSPSWLHACMTEWRRVEECHYSLVS